MAKMRRKAGGRPVEPSILNAFKIDGLVTTKLPNMRLKFIGAWYLYLSRITVLP